MKRHCLLLIILGFTFLGFSQAIPNDCVDAVPGCTTPAFGIAPNDPATNIVDFTAGSISNPSTNPNPGNSGCLLSGETSSTFITINVVSTGTLEWSIIGNSGGCFDWIMWPYSPTACAGINGNTLPPVACNWNGMCNGNTGMSSPANLPANGSWTSYEAPLNVTAGQQFILCLSNYSGTTQDVNLNFFGSANVSCNPSAASQTICLGQSANVVITTGGLPSPTFNWLVTNGVPNPSAGPNVTVTPTVTTTYQVEVEQQASASQAYLLDTVEFTITVINPPAPNAGVDQTVCLGTPISLSGIESYTPNSSTWQTVVPPGLTPAATASFSPNFSSLTPTVTVNQPGLYKFILRESSTVCGMGRDTVLVTVSDVNLTATPTSPSCGGYSDGQIAITSSGATEYSFDGGSTWQTSNTQGGFTAGPYTVCAKNIHGCQKCITTTIIDPVPVTISVSNDTLICENGTASLLASAIGGNAFTFIWSHTQSTLPNQDVSPAVNTTYSVIAQNESGCQSPSASIDVTIRAPLSATITPDQYVCPGYPGTIAVMGTGGIGSPYTYTWSTGVTQTGATSSITESPQVSTTYTVTMEDACESTPYVISTQILTHPVPVPLIAVDEPVKCEPALFTLTNQTDPVMSAGTIWNISDGQQFINMNEIQPEALYDGIYDVQLIVVSPDGCIDSTTFVGYLNVRPKPVAEFKWSPDPVLMFNTEVLLTNYSTGADSYQWTIESGSPSTSVSEDVVTVFPDGISGYYEVTLISTSDLGCTDTVTRIIPVMPEVLIYAPNSFTPDGDEYNQTWRVYMEGIDLYDFELLVINRWGEIVWESKDLNAEWDGTYNGRIIPSGTYSWVIRTKDLLNDGKYTYEGYVNIIR